MRKLSESMWMDAHKKNIGIEDRKENQSKMIYFDGEKYVLLNFNNQEQEYIEETEADWKVFAFNNPGSGNRIDEITFGEDQYELGDANYDVYVIKDMIENPNWIDSLLENIIGYDDIPEKEIADVINKYVKKIYSDNHASQLAQYLIYELWPTNWVSSRYLYSVIIDANITAEEMITDEDDEFYGMDNDALIVSFPMLENWYEDFEKELKDVFEKYGWKASETYEPDPYDGGPSNIQSICFVKL